MILCCRHHQLRKWSFSRRRPRRCATKLCCVSRLCRRKRRRVVLTQLPRTHRQVPRLFWYTVCACCPGSTGVRDQREGTNAPYHQEYSVEAERIRPWHWLESILWVSFSTLTLAGWQKRSPVHKLEALGQCVPPPRPSYQCLYLDQWCGSPPKFNNFFIGPLPTFPENFIQIRSEVFAQNG